MLNVRLRLATTDDIEPLGAIHRAAMRQHVEKTWGWDEEWQTTFFREHGRLVLKLAPYPLVWR